ncbi:FAD-binding monooxygenase [Labrenzia sp. R5_0]|jgi:2-polyprenyl-6-methoxyphenol hydroxylase-like FAD-dependent oxidoreductase|uniref:FAD-binding monooxygenase n=1 Tax=Labrenzia sp. R5_0 TaxID=2821108 RepID=UPI001ADAA3A7|nr:FAD-binding monooxygenase [Labrenzia sp. R5_0]MBO9460919.1 FAD-binding monooxygenase [Labrenzia sp. R5_0]
MQFHLDGFKTGDPVIHEPNADATALANTDSLPEEVDVLIVGCGPAGLTLAAQLAAFPDIRTRIVEQKAGPLKLGQADGVACRTMEMFEAFGFAERLEKEAYWVNETTFWKPDPASPDTIARSGRVQDVEDGLSEFPHVILNQARVHDFYLEIMRNSPNRLEPNYSRRLIDLDMAAEAGQEWPVTVQLERMDPGHEGETETVRAKYVVGCDGARSSVRRALGRELKGDSANQAWGVMDVLAVTDFPDIRFKALVQSASEGSILIIPREGGYLVRIYVELDKLRPDERVANRNITVDHLIAAAGRILHPYSLDVKEVAWWSVYEIGQRLCEKFDDVPAEGAPGRLPHVFIAGDACHTHSPKAGQGMNVSMQDTFNLGWKLAHVLKGLSEPQLLASYSAERQAIAQNLIDFDREWAKLVSAPVKSDSNPDGVDPAEVQKYFVQHGRYTAGTASRYLPSVLTGGGAHQHLAEGFQIGMRFHSAPVVRLADAKPVQLGHVVKADGRWRIFAFADKGDPAAETSAIRRLCNFLQDDLASPVLRHTAAGEDIDAVMDLRAVFQQNHRDLTLERMPSLLLPAKGRYGLRDYEKMFCPDLNSGNDIFEMRGIDRDKGCLVIVRPDQYVAEVLPLDAHEALSGYFQGILKERR